MKKLSASYMLVMMICIALSPFAYQHFSSAFAVGSSETQTDPTPVYGGTLRIGETLFVLARYMSKYLVYNGLVRLNQSLQLVPDLAESWQISPDNSSYTFYLRQNVTWHDGVPFNASDVKFTYETLMNHPGLILWPCTASVMSQVLSIDIISPYIVVIHLKEPSSTFIFNGGATFMWPKHVYENGDLSKLLDISETPGTGPFKFKNWSAEYITLEANLNYFRGRPYLDEVIYKIYPDVEMPTALENNEIDLIPGGVSPEKVSEIESIPGLTIESKTRDLHYGSLDFCFHNPILNDSSVRQAIAHAINRTRIIEDVYLGYAEPAYSPIPPVLTYWHNSNVSRYDFDPAMAEQLLDNAGYHRDPQTGWRFNLSLKVGDWDTHRVDSARIIEEFLETIGINITLEAESLPELMGDVFSGIFDLYVGEVSPGADPDQSIIWHSEGENNFMGYNNSYVDALLELGLNTTDDADRKQIYNEFQEIIASDLPSLMLYHETQLVAYNNDFQDFYIMNGKFYIASAIVLEKVWYMDTLSSTGKSPMLVSYLDSQGRRTGYDVISGQVVFEIPNSTYSGIDSDPQVVKILSPLGDYTVELLGTGNGVYQLEIVNIALEYKHVSLLEGSITEGETKCYKVSVFPDGSITVVPLFGLSATVDIDPDTLNLKSNGQWLTAYITLPEGYNVGDIVLETVEVEGVLATWSEVQNGVYMAKFDRALLRDTLTGIIDYEEGIKFYELTLSVIGELADGTPFEGTDTIVVIYRG